MNNITYSITENVGNDLISSNSPNSDNWEEIPLTNKKSKTDNNVTINMIDNGERYARELDYDLNYNVKYLTHILEYYGLQNPNKLNQDDINKSDNKN